MEAGHFIKANKDLLFGAVVHAKLLAGLVEPRAVPGVAKAVNAQYVARPSCVVSIPGRAGLGSIIVTVVVPLRSLVDARRVIAEQI